MTLLERLRGLRTEPIIIAWAEDCDVMWLPQCVRDGIAVPFYSMEKEADTFLLKRTSTRVELSWPQLWIRKMERSEGNGEENAVFQLRSSDGPVCRELFVKYHESMERYLCSAEPADLEDAKACETEINRLLRRKRI